MSLLSRNKFKELCNLIEKGESNILTKQKAKKLRKQLSELKELFKKYKQLKYIKTTNWFGSLDNATTINFDGTTTIVEDVETYSTTINSGTINGWYHLVLVEDQKPEETENYYRIPPSGVDPDAHSGHKIRTIDIDEDRGIKAVYCVDCKQILVYLLPKDSFSSMEEAQEWVDNHGS